MILYIIISMFAVPSLSSEEINCRIPSHFTVNLRSEHKAEIFDGKLNIQFARDTIKVYTYQKTNDVNFVINETLVTFHGGMVVDNMFHQMKIINQVLHPRTIGISVLEEISCFDTILTQCQIFLPRNKSDSTNFPYEVENEILQLAASCMNVKLSDKIGSLLPEDYSNSETFHEFGPLSVNPAHESINSCSERPITEDKKKLISIQMALNTIVDVAVIIARGELKKRNLVKIRIPDVFEPFETFSNSVVKIKGYFNATDGYFKDLSTLKRTSDVVLVRSGQKLSLSFGFGLETPEIEFKHYKVKYGILPVEGEVSASVESLAFNAKVSVNYEREHCKARLENFHISHFDELKIKITGAGVLSKVVSKIATRAINKWITEIVQLVESLIGPLVVSVLSEQDCEAYRPAFEEKCD